MERVVERTKAKQALVEQAVSPTPTASEAVEIAAASPFQFSPYDQARVVKWMRDRLIDWPPTSCLHCRKPVIVGQLWAVVSNGEVRARFHEPCYGEVGPAGSRRPSGAGAEAMNHVAFDNLLTERLDASIVDTPADAAPRVALARPRFDAGASLR
jgi:hypothetical protein